MTGLLVSIWSSVFGEARPRYNNTRDISDGRRLGTCHQFLIIDLLSKLIWCRCKWIFIIWMLIDSLWQRVNGVPEELRCQHGCVRWTWIWVQKGAILGRVRSPSFTPTVTTWRVASSCWKLWGRARMVKWSWHERETQGTW